MAVEEGAPAGPIVDGATAALIFGVALAVGGIAVALTGARGSGPGPAPCSSPCPCPCGPNTVCNASSGRCLPIIPASGCAVNCAAQGLVCNSVSGACENQPGTGCLTNPRACPPGAYCATTDVCINPQPCIPSCRAGSFCATAPCGTDMGTPGCGECLQNAPPVGGWNVWDLAWSFDEPVNPVGGPGSSVNGTITFLYTGPGGSILIGFEATDTQFLLNCGTMSFPSQVGFDLQAATTPQQAVIGTYQLYWPGCFSCIFSHDRFIVTPFIVAGGATWRGPQQAGALGLSC